MVEIQPFKGILYNQEIISDISRVVAPPYDVISKEQQERYYQNHPYNCIRLILGKDFPEDNEEDNKYTRAANYFNTWLTQKILKQDDEEAIYPLVQEFSYNNKKITRTGFITLMRLEDLGTNVFPHEKTLPKFKQDRLNLMLATKANLCQVFALYSDEKGTLDEYLNVEKASPIIEVKDDAMISHRLFRLIDKTKIQKIKEVMQSKIIFIADGHHRYETALTARNILGYDFIMIYLTKMENEGLIIFPTHRLISNQALNYELDTQFIIQNFTTYFEVEMVDNCGELLEEMKGIKEPNHAFGMYTQGKSYLLVLKDNNIMDKLIGDEKSKEYKQLDVVILQTLIINHILKIPDMQSHISYTHDENEAIVAVNEKKCSLALFLNPTKINQLRQIALQCEIMPQKSTYFYPKLLSGLVMNKFLF